MKRMIRFIYKKIFIILLFLPSCLLAQDATDSTIMYGYEYIDYEGDINSLPKIKVDTIKIKEVLSKYAIYPRFAKSKFLGGTIDIITTIDQAGAISEISISNPYHAMFDTVAIRLVLATKGMWEPAIVKGKPKGRVITIPVTFRISGDSLSHAIEYSVNIFASHLKLSSDSANTFPAIVRATDSTILISSKRKLGYPKQRTFRTSINKRLFDVNSLDPVFGTVRLGFNLSKDSKISDIKILHSVSKKYDDRALSCLKDLEPEFSPAHENGIPIDSYIEFDFKFDNYIYSRYNNYKIIGHATNAKLKADELLQEKKYEKALPYLIKANNYYLDDIKILYQLALVNFQLNKIEEGCDFLSKLKSVAIDTFYPSTINEEDVIALYETYCK